MYKENNCQCVVCKVERELLKTLNTQTVQTHFKALASNHPVSNHLSSPLEAIARLHGQVGAGNHDSGNQILHALIHAVSDKAFEDLGQQLLLVAFTPAIHKIYREICQRFPTLPPDDVVQQTWVAFLEIVKSPAMLRQNGQLPVALVMNSRKAVLRWAVREARRASLVEDGFEELSEPLSEENFEHAILLEEFLGRSQRDGLLSEAEHKLLLKRKFEGFEAKELVDVQGMPSTNHRRVHRLVQTIVNRLQRGARCRGVAKANEDGCKPQMNLLRTKKNFVASGEFLREGAL
jgi:DNA-directed RNA polymerase specialized sigma24 family protein